MLSEAAGASRFEPAKAPRPERARRFSFESKMMLPALVILALISIAPLLYIIWMSFNEVSLLGGGGLSIDWAGVQNWQRMFTDPNVGAGWISMVIYFVATVGIEMVVGLAVALLVYEIVWGRNVAMSLMLIPMFVAPVIVGLLGRFMVNTTYGLYAWVLDVTGIYSGNILGGPVSAFIAVILMNVWEWTPLIILISLAGLVSIQPQLLEAAKVDGASYLQRLRHIMLPSIASIVIVALLIRSMDALRYFSIIWLSTGGGPANTTKIIPLRLYEVAFRFLHLGYAASIGLVMLAVSILLATLFLTIMRRRGLVQ